MVQTTGSIQGYHIRHIRIISEMSLIRMYLLVAMTYVEMKNTIGNNI